MLFVMDQVHAGIAGFQDDDVSMEQLIFITTAAIVSASIDLVNNATGPSK
jgi:hypothetical protein